MFKINNKFLKSSHYLLDLKLCTVRLHDNCKFPWIMLIPKRKNINEITELNVEKIGNIVPQLHIHIIARFKKDSSWPLSVWVVKGKCYSAKALKEVISKIRFAFK